MICVFMFWIIVHFFIVECSAACSVNDDDKLISWPMSYLFQLLQCQEVVHDAVLLYFCNGYKKTFGFSISKWHILEDAEVINLKKITPTWV